MALGGLGHIGDYDLVRALSSMDPINGYDLVRALSSMDTIGDDGHLLWFLSCMVPINGMTIL